MNMNFIKQWFKPKPKPWLTRDEKGQLVTASDIKAHNTHGSYGSGGGSADSSAVIVASCIYSDLL